MPPSPTSVVWLTLLCPKCGEYAGCDTEPRKYPACPRCSAAKVLTIVDGEGSTTHEVPWFYDKPTASGYLSRDFSRKYRQFLMASDCWPQQIAGREKRKPSLDDYDGTWR